MSSGVRRTSEAIGATLLYALIVPWLFRPWFLDADSLPHSTGAVGAMVDADLYLNVWILAWIAHAAVHAPLELFDGNIFHPALGTIAGSENMLAHAVVTAPVLAATGSALAVLKAYLVETFALSGLGMFLFVRHHTGSGWAGLVAGAAYTFTPFRVDTVPQPQYLGIAFLPLAWLAADLHLESGRMRWLVAYGAALVLQALSCVYVGYFAFLLCPVYVFARIAGGATPRPERWRALARLAVATIVAAVALIPLLVPYLAARSSGMIPDHDLASLVATSWHPLLFLSPEFLARVGVVPVLLVVAGLLGTLVASRSRHTVARDHGESPVAALVTVALVTAVLAAGPFLTLSGDTTIPLPYVALYELLPGFSSVRVPIRFLIVIGTAIAALGGIAFGRWAHGRGWAVAGSAATSLALLAAWTSAPTPHATMDARLTGDEAAVYRWLAERPGPGAILEVPGQSTEQDVVGNLRNGRYMTASTLHWRPLLNGYTAYPPPSAAFFAAAIRDLPEAAALDLLRETTALRWILVHRDELTPNEARHWPRDAPTGLRSVARFGATEVYELTGFRDDQAAARTAARLDGPPADRTLQGTPRAPLAPACRRGVIVSADVPSRLPALPLARRTTVRVKNESDCPWPARGLRADGLVGIEYRWLDALGAEETSRGPKPLARFLADIPPGEQAEGAIALAPPKGPPGRWTLEIQLVQQGDPTPIALRRFTVDVRTPRIRPRNTAH